MKTTKYFAGSVGFLYITVFAGCKHTPPVDLPGPPSYADCSYTLTEFVQNVNEYYVDSGGSIDPLPYYYQGFDIKDISFNPNNPNEIALAVFIRSDISIGENSSSSIVTVDLCNGSHSVLYNDLGPFRSVDWGIHDTIVFSTNNPLERIRTIRSDGDGYHIVPTNSMVIHSNPTWTPQGNILVRADDTMRIIDVEGNLIDDNLDFLANGTDYISPDTIGYIDWNQTGTYYISSLESNALSQFDLSPVGLEVAYNPVDNQLLWVADTIVAVNNLNDGSREDLTYGYNGTRIFQSADASVNGYLGFVAHINELDSSNQTQLFYRSEIRFINPDGTDERRLILDFE